MTPIRVAILISGNGSNMQSIVKWASKKSEINVVTVISNNPQAEGLKWVEGYNQTHNTFIKPKYISTDPYKTKLIGVAENNYIDYLKSEKIDLICLAGFMILVKENFVKTFLNRIINIHPSLLPDYKGLHTHARVITDKKKESGCTIHYVNENMDDGKIIKQRKVEVSSTDTPESLQRKILTQEHLLYPEVLQSIVEGNTAIGNRGEIETIYKDKFFMKIQKICGFEFVKIGEAYLSDEPLKATYNGKPLKDWRLKLRLVVSEEILKSEQSTYLVFKDNDLLYVGYFSTSLKDRWWKKKGYFWNGEILDMKVNELVKSGHDISLWITVNPYSQDKHNISKVIEDKIIAEYLDKGILNKVGKSSNWYKKNTKPVKEILGLH